MYVNESHTSEQFSSDADMRDEPIEILVELPSALDSAIVGASASFSEAFFLTSDAATMYDSLRSSTSFVFSIATVRCSRSTWRPKHAETVLERLNVTMSWYEFATQKQALDMSYMKYYA